MEFSRQEYWSGLPFQNRNPHKSWPRGLDHLPRKLSRLFLPCLSLPTSVSFPPSGTLSGSKLPTSSSSSPALAAIIPSFLLKSPQGGATDVIPTEMPAHNSWWESIASTLQSRTWLVHDAYIHGGFLLWIFPKLILPYCSSKRSLLISFSFQSL